MSYSDAWQAEADVTFVSPMKRGLKEKARNRRGVVFQVTFVSPMKRGLKGNSCSSISPIERIVTFVSPMKRGLKDWNTNCLTA